MASDHIYNQEASPDTASAALTTLFASTQEYPHLDLAIDPALQSAQETAPPLTGGDVPGEGVVPESGDGDGSNNGADAEGEGNGKDESGTADDAGADPADAESGTANGTKDNAAAGVKRKATSRINMLPRGGACEFCKRRKLKCTAEQPQCRACARSGRDCVYSQKQQRSRVRVLEDKLLELERRLDQERQANANQATGGGNHSHNTLAPPSNPWMGTSPAEVTSVPSSTNPPLPTIQFLPADQTQAPSAGVELFLGLGPDAFTLADMPFPKNREPDLMTLADAAAGNANSSWPWEGMTPTAIAAELTKAVVENHKGMGERIIAHLLQAFSRPPHIKIVHMVVSPTVFFDRLTGVKGLPPHPALMAALIPNILFLSPSPLLNHRDTIAAACDALIPVSRQLAQMALSNLDNRVLDLVAAASLRSIALAAVGRFVDSWNENSLSVGLVWSVGIAKLGHVMEEFVPVDQRPADRVARLDHETRLRNIRGKSQICPPPTDMDDGAGRIRLFWSVYMSDRGSGIGWHWPGLMDYTEITTPLPHDTYDTPEQICDNRTLEDFMSGRVGTTPNEGVFSLQVKTMTILYEASRLLDKDPGVATPDKTAHLIRISKRHMTALPPFSPADRSDALRQAGIADIWVGMYTALMLLYGKEEVDSPSAEETAEALQKGIDSSLKMCEIVEAAVAAGDTELQGCDITAPTIWCIAGRTMHHYAKRIESRDPAKAQLIRDKLRMLVDASRRVSNNLRLAEVYAQMLHNITLDAEAMLGEYQRPDNTDFMGATPHYSPLSGTTGS